MSRTHLFIILSSVAMLIFVLDLVRRRRLREEYAWLWLLASLIYLVFALSPKVSTIVADFLGTNNLALAFTFLGLQFLALISIQFSTRLSRLTTQVKNLSQQLAILDGETIRWIETYKEKMSNQNGKKELLIDEANQSFVEPGAELPGAPATLTHTNDSQRGVSDDE